jgi:hypothetical protein
MKRLFIVFGGSWPPVFSSPVSRVEAQDAAQRMRGKAAEVQTGYSR